MHNLHYKASMDTRVALKSVKFIEGDAINTWCYLDITYEVETPYEKTIVRMPKLALPINYWGFNIKYDQSEMFEWQRVKADVGFGWAHLEPDENGHYYIETIVDQKIQEMSVAEIEDKLGYKIKVVRKD